MSDLLNEATAVLPSSQEEFKKIIKEVMRVTFERCNVATRFELQNKPELLKEGQYQLTKGAPWYAPLKADGRPERPHHWLGISNRWLEQNIPLHIHAAITNVIKPRPADVSVPKDDETVLFNYSRAEWSDAERHQPRRLQALLTISARTDVPVDFNPKHDMWNELGPGLTRLQGVASGQMTFAEAAIEYATRQNSTKVSKEQRQALTAASTCSQLTAIAQEHTPTSEGEDHDESWRRIKIQPFH